MAILSPCFIPTLPLSGRRFSIFSNRFSLPHLVEREQHGTARRCFHPILPKDYDLERLLYDFIPLEITASTTIITNHHNLTDEGKGITDSGSHETNMFTDFAVRHSFVGIGRHLGFPLLTTGIIPWSDVFVSINDQTQLHVSKPSGPGPNSNQWGHCQEMLNERTPLETLPWKP